MKETISFFKGFCKTSEAMKIDYMMVAMGLISVFLMVAVYWLGASEMDTTRSIFMPFALPFAK
jgi:hypothetical protein